MSKLLFTRIYSLWPSDSIWRHWSGSTLALVSLLPDGTSPELLLTYHWSVKSVVFLFTWEQFHWKRSRYLSLEYVAKWHVQNYHHISQGSMSVRVIIGAKVLLPAVGDRRFKHGSSTHWGRVTHICVNKLTVIGSDNGLSPGRRQAIIWASAGILLIRTLGTNSVKS